MEFSSFYPLFTRIFKENGLDAFTDEATAVQFHLLAEHMLKVGETMNLTAIKEMPAVILLHFADSLTVCPLLPPNARVIDVGCGAGFPSLPLCIVRPDLTVTALDSTEKRVRYVEETGKLLGLSNLKTVVARAEEYGGKGEGREAFDVVTARAVAALPALAEICLPMVKKGGRFIAMKASRADAEWKAAQNAVGRLGGALKEAHRITLKQGGEAEERVLFEVEKIAPTPKEYPRAWGKILKKPLA